MIIMPQLKTILLVEDSPNDAELTMKALKSNNLANSIVLVRDGVEALDYLYARGSFAQRPKGNPAVVILDIKLPKINGIEVLRTIKGDDSLKSTPVVMLTSSREEKDLITSYDLGANAFVVKPVDFSAFLRAVKEIGCFWAIINEAPIIERLNEQEKS